MASPRAIRSETESFEVPERSLAARRGAAQKASVIRTRRAELRRDIKAGRVQIERVLLEPPGFVETAKVFDLLLSKPGIGRVKANKLLQTCRISPSKTIGGLTDRQRAELVGMLRPASGRPRAPVAPGQPLRSAGFSERDQASVGWRLVGEVKRLLDYREVSDEVVERAARIAVAEQSWRDGLGDLLAASDTEILLGVDAQAIAELVRAGRLIVLEAQDGGLRYPAFQFQEGVPSQPLVEAHNILVKKGCLSPWSAAGWARTEHPELDYLSPAQWAGRRGDEERLLRTAERDASRLAQ